MMLKALNGFYQARCVSLKWMVLKNADLNPSEVSSVGVREEENVLFSCFGYEIKSLKGCGVLFRKVVFLFIFFSRNPFVGSMHLLKLNAFQIGLIKTFFPNLPINFLSKLLSIQNESC